MIDSLEFYYEIVAKFLGLWRMKRNLILFHFQFVLEGHPSAQAGLQGALHLKHYNILIVVFSLVNL